MRVHVCDPEVLVKNTKGNKVTVSQAECSLVHHGVFGRSECLAEKGSNPLGAFRRSILSRNVKY